MPCRALKQSWPAVGSTCNHARAAGTPVCRDHQHAASERAWRLFTPSALGRAPDEDGRRAGGVRQPPQRATIPYPLPYPVWAAHPTKNGGTPVASDSRPSAPTSGLLKTAHSATPPASLAAARSTSVPSLASAPSSSSSSASSPSPAAAPLRARVRQGRSPCAASAPSVAPDSGHFLRAPVVLISILSAEHNTARAQQSAKQGSRAISACAGGQRADRTSAAWPPATRWCALHAALDLCHPAKTLPRAHAGGAPARGQARGRRGVQQESVRVRARAGRAHGGRPQRGPPTAHCAAAAARGAALLPHPPGGQPGGGHRPTPKPDLARQSGHTSAAASACQHPRLAPRLNAARAKRRRPSAL